MGRTRRKGGSRKKRGGLFDEIKAVVDNQVAIISKSTKDAAEKTKKMVGKPLAY